MSHRSMGYFFCGRPLGVGLGKVFDVDICLVVSDASDPTAR